MAIDENGYLWACGNNGFGQLGLGDNKNRNTFVKIGNTNNAQYLMDEPPKKRGMKTKGAHNL